MEATNDQINPKLKEYAAFAGGYLLAPTEAAAPAQSPTLVPKLSCAFGNILWEASDDYDTIKASVALATLPAKEDVTMVLVRLERVPNFLSNHGRHYDAYVWGASNYDFLGSDATALEIEASMFRDHFDSDDQFQDGETVRFHILCIDQEGMPLGFASSEPTVINKTVV